MRIREKDLEILAGTQESITYIRYDRTYDDNGVLGTKVLGSFVQGEDVITFKVYPSLEDNLPVITKIATITDGKAVISLLGTDTATLEPKTYIYDVFWVHLSESPICLVAPSNFEIVYTSETDLGS